MRRLQLFLTSLVLLTVAACDHPNRGIMMEIPPKPLRLARPETTYRLSQADRAKLQAGFDADALERLLRMIRPDMRQEILIHFQVSGVAGRQYGQLVQFHDPQLQPLLEEVWAPMWEEVGATDQQIEENVFQFPGREIARRRRAAAGHTRSHAGS